MSNVDSAFRNEAALVRAGSGGVLDRPEVREAIAKLRTALEDLRDDYEPVLSEARALPEQARLLTINDNDDLELVVGWTREQVLPVRDRVQNTIGPWVKLTDTLHVFFCDLKRLGLDPCKEATDAVNAIIRDFHARQKILREEAIARQRALQREAERRGHLERAWFLTGVAISQAAQCIAEDEKRLAEAAAAEKSGDKSRADMIRSEVGFYTPPPLDLPPPPPVAPVVPIPAAAKAKGLSIPDDWRGELVEEDPDAFMKVVAFVAGNPSYRHLLLLDESAVNRLAKSLKERLGEVVPGLRAVNRQRVAHRRK